MTDPDRLQDAFDIRQNDQFVDDGVRRFGSNDARLGQAQITAPVRRCLAWEMVAPLSGPFITPVAQPVQISRLRRPSSWPTFLVYLYSSVLIEWPPQHTTIFGSTPGRSVRALRSKWNVVGDARRAAQVDTRANIRPLYRPPNDVAQGAEQHLTGAGDHFAVNKGVGGGVEQFKAHTSVLLVNPYLEILVGLKDGLGVIDVSASVQNCQYALAEQCVAAT